ncbi:MAG TPA: hypothetical protein DDW52_10730 [Planctomycetaceae bacterium]|nr:hypothetical protein [Planctomycetaceae bacterium]
MTFHRWPTVSVFFTLVFASLGSSGFSQTPSFGGAARIASWKTHLDMAAQSPFRHLEWQAMGPKFAGGRIESIAVPPNDLGTIYVGVGSGGVWKTINGGLTWRPIFADQSTFSIGDIAISASDPNIVWVGTGECHLSRTSYPGNGVFKSVDGGETWENMGLHESAHIGSVLVHPKDPNVVFVAAMGRKQGGGQRGIYRTLDGGESFECTLEAGRDVAFVDLVFDPHNPDRLFASSWDRARSKRSGVYRSEDGGDTWKKLSGGLLEQNVDRVAIDVATSQPGVVYALMADASSPALAQRRNASVLFRSDDSGDSWRRTHDAYVPTYIGWDFCDVRVAPDDAEKVYVGGTRLIISSDGGRTFEGEGGFAVNTRRDEVFRIHPTRGIGMHLDVHDIWIDPANPERVLQGNDGGLYVSTDRGLTWLHLNTLPIAEFYKVHVDSQQPPRIWAGTQDNASFVGPTTARLEEGVDDDWQQVFLDPWTGGDGFSTFPDPNDPQITFYTQQMGDLKRSRLGRLRHEKSIRPRSEDGRAQLRFSWDTPFFASSHSGPTVLYCGAQRVFRSTDRGETWQSISPDLVKRSALLALAESPLDSRRLVAGAGRGQVFTTENGGESWRECSDGLPKFIVRDVIASQHNATTLFAVCSGKEDSDCTSHVYRSVDYGESWESIAAGLPAECCNAIAEDPVDNEILFVGTDLGVYVSTDTGQSWHSLSASLPTASVVDLAVSPDGLLVAATHGLSLFCLDISGLRTAEEP